MPEKENRLGLSEYQAHTQEIEQACLDWWEGRLDDDALIEKTSTFLAQRYQIREITSDDDDFDWHSLPAETLQTCHEAWLDHGNAVRLLHAVKKTIEQLRAAPPLRFNSIARAAILGNQMREFEIDYHRLKASRSPNRLPDAPEPPPPTI